MMNDAKIRSYFGRWEGRVSDDLQETWARLRAAVDLSAMQALLSEMIGIRNTLINRYVTPFRNDAKTLDKVSVSLAELETLAGSDARLIDLWNAKYAPNKAPKAAIQAMEAYQGKRQAVKFAFSSTEGTPLLSMEFRRSVHITIDPVFAIHPKETVGWIRNKVALEQRRLILQAEDPSHKTRIETAGERAELVHQGIKYYENESIKLPTWEQITGTTAEVEPTAEALPQTNDGLSYRGIAYYLICEGRPINGEIRAAELYDSLSQYSKKSTAPTRGQLLLDEYNDLQGRHGYEGRRLGYFQRLMNELEEMNILSPDGMEVLKSDKKEAEKYL